MTRILQWTLLITVCIQLGYGQDNTNRTAKQTVTGLVTSKQNGSVAGVNVAIKRSSQGVAKGQMGDIPFRLIL